MRNAKGHHRDMPDVLACEATTLNCELIKVDTGTCKTSNSRGEKKNALTCGEEVVLIDSEQTLSVDLHLQDTLLPHVRTGRKESCTSF